jgi:hypothetical protein
MAFSYVTEYARGAQVENGQLLQVGAEPPLNAERVANAGATTQGSAFNAKTKFIMVHTDSICSYKIGANPTAVTSEGRMAAGETRYFGVNPGDKIAFILNT